MSASDLPPPSDAVRPEVELLLCCGQPRVASRLSRIEALLREEIDWTDLVRMALAHGVSSLLARGLGQVCSGVPEEIQEALREHLSDNRARNLELARVLVDLLGVLDEHGAAAIPFKGPVLGAVAYGDFSLRRAGDLDIFVRRDDLSIVCQTLAASGFRELTECRTGRPLSAAEDAAYRRYQCEYAFVRESDRVVVEPHWAIAPKAMAVPLDYPDLWARARPAFMFGREILSFAHEDLLMLLTIHGAKHEWAQLRWICDLAALIERHPRIDLESALARAWDRGCGRMLLVGLGLTRRVLGTELLPPILRHLDGDRTALALVNRVASRLFRKGPMADTWGRVTTFLIRVRERPLDRARYVVRTIATPRIDHVRLVSLPPWLHGLYVPIKLLHDYLLLPLWHVTKHVRTFVRGFALSRSG